jgi:hypothetical protein
LFLKNLTDFYRGEKEEKGKIERGRDRGSEKIRGIS